MTALSQQQGTTHSPDNEPILVCTLPLSQTCCFLNKLTHCFDVGTYTVYDVGPIESFVSHTADTFRLDDRKIHVTTSQENST